MSYKTIICETDDHIGIIRLNRPEALNALCTELMIELGQALLEFENNENIATTVITGNEKAFAAGADIKEMQNKGYTEVYNEDYITRHWQEVLKCRKPVIAAVSGYALGGGCELAMMCDFIIASESAQFGQPEVNLAIVPGAGGTQRLARFIGKSKAMDLCLSGRMMDADEAERCGLVSQILPDDDFIEAVKKIAQQIAGKSIPALMMNKECINQAFETSLKDGLLFERRQFHATFATQDQKEGMTAFIEKRKPKWQHK